MNHKTIGDRGHLNPKTSGLNANFRWRARAHTPELPPDHEDYNETFSGFFAISDCDKTIKLALGSKDAAGRELVMNKLATLANGLIDCINQYAAASAEIFGEGWEAKAPRVYALLEIADE